MKTTTLPTGAARGPDAAKLTTIVNDTGSTGTRYTDGTFPEQTTHHCAVVALSAPTAAEPRPPRTAARQWRTTGRHGTAGRQRNAREKTPASRNAMPPETGHP